MRIRTLPMLMAVVVAGSLAMGTWVAQGDETYAMSAAPQSANSVAEIIRLSQAKISDDTIINYIKNSGHSYRLNANDIIYLKKQGVSEAVIDAMLQQQTSGGDAANAANQPMPAAQFVGTTDTGTASDPGNVSYSTPSDAAPSDATPPTPTTSWPLVVNNGSTTFTVFQPHSDSWDGHNLVARSAIAVQLAGQSQTSYGVIGFSAITLVDKNTRTASLADIKITSANFPSASGQTQDYLALLRQELPNRAPTMTLDGLETGLNLPAPKTETLNNLPPNIIVAMRPAELVSIDGPPVLRPVSGTGLDRVINTQMLLLKGPSGRYYLHLFNGYLQADSLKGPWTVASEPPAGAATAEQEATESGNADLMTGQPDPATGKMPTLSASTTPDVFVATSPSELISFNGQPQYAPISGTDLLYAENTSGNVFRSLNDQKYYILISGRWYSALSLQGPWRFVPGNNLPSDFANIPDTSPKKDVKASVPGTTQAQEALIANSIPQSTAVARTTQMANPQIDGAPQLAAIEGTPLHYVVNSATPIIEVDSQDWYACQNGVWYVSTSPNGPWAVAAAVPQVIYTIPTTSPLHYLTYVQVYGSTPDQVYDGYTPGYMGTEVDDENGDNSVVYGTGYDYPPWIGSDYYPSPTTWGWGFGPSWTPWYGWGYGPGFGWGWGNGGFGLGWGLYPPFPWWGGFGFRFGFGFNHGFNHGFAHGFNHGFNAGFNHGFNHGFANTGMNLFHPGGFNGGRGFAFGASRIGVGNFNRSFSSAGVFRNSFGPFGTRSGGVFRNSFGPFGTHFGVFPRTFPGFGNRGFNTFGNRGFSTFGNRGFNTFGNPGFIRFGNQGFRSPGFGGFRGGGFRGGFGGGFHGGGGGFHGGGGGGGGHR